MKPLLITIDGPAGAGKTTVSKMLAEKLGYRYLDTGALYRAVALKAIDNNIDIRDESALAELCRHLDIRIVEKNGAAVIFCDGLDVTDRLRTERVSMAASKISAKAYVREALMGLQREIGEKKALVAEGRDMGTVVFVDADVKFFLDASPRIRAERRYKERPFDNSSTLEQVEEQIRQRDMNDSSRQLAPLREAPDAVRIDSTGLTADQVVKRMVEEIFKKFLKE